MRFFSFIILAILAGVGYFLFKINQPISLISNDNFIEIKNGDTISSVGKTLNHNNMQVSPLLLKLAYHLLVRNNTIKAGTYNITKGENIVSLLTKISEGKAVQNKITIIEGETVQDVIAMLAKIQWLQGSITRVPKEGMLAPGTYFFTIGTARQTVLDFVQNEQETLARKLFNSQGPGLPFKDFYELITFASIVEKEMATLEEAPIVAEVFLNRLKKGMMLESCATVIYWLNLQGNKKVTRLYNKDISADSPYNTYKKRGLPPTAICNPGAKTIAACLKPSNYGYLFFVKEPLKKAHKFSTTFSEHKKNTAKYLSSLASVPKRPATRKVTKKKKSNKKAKPSLKNLFYRNQRNARLRKNRRYA